MFCMNCWEDGDIPQGGLTTILKVVITMKMFHWKSFMITNQSAKTLKLFPPRIICIYVSCIFVVTAFEVLWVS